MTDILVITGCPAPGGRRPPTSLEDLGWFVVDNLPTSLDREDRRAGRRAAGRPSTASPSSSAAAPTRPTSSTWSPRLRAAGHRVRILFLEASDAGARHAATAAPAASTRSPTARSSVLEPSSTSATLLEPVQGEADLVDRHDRPQRAPAQGPPGRRSSARRSPDGRHAGRRRVVRLQARPAARRRHRARLPLPAEPVLGRATCAPSPASSPSRAAVRAGANEVTRTSSTASTTCSTCCCRPTQAEGKSYLTHRHRLHRRAAPLGGHRRGAGRAARAQGGREPRVQHRDLPRSG